MTQDVTPVITCRGRYLYCGSDRFIVRGIVYQPRERNHDVPKDALCDTRIDQVTRDIEVLKDLGVNVIWVYKIDPRVKHDACMSALSKAGIYVIASLFDGNFKHVISRTDPRGSYTQGTRDMFNSIVDCLAAYDNTLGVSICNDLINEGTGTKTQTDVIIEVLGVAIAELKAHMDTANRRRNQRRLPIGMADTSWALHETRSFEYLTHMNVDGRPSSGRLDFYGVNHYNTTNHFDSKAVTHKDSNTNASHTLSNLSVKQHRSWNQIHTLAEFNDPANAVPVILSEYSGASLNNEPRHFRETTELFLDLSASSTPPASTPSSSSADQPGAELDVDVDAITGNALRMLDILSGGCMYEFYNGSNRYGIVQEDHQTGRLVKLQPEYDYFRARLRGLPGVSADATGENAAKQPRQ